jgi:hypothetical protein
MPCLACVVTVVAIHTAISMTHHTIGGRLWLLGCWDCSLIRLYTSLSSNFVSKTASAFQSCYNISRILTGMANSITSLSHVGTPLLHTAHGSRPSCAREGCTADGAAMVAGHLSCLPAVSPEQSRRRPKPTWPVVASLLASTHSNRQVLHSKPNFLSPVVEYKYTRASP